MVHRHIAGLFAISRLPRIAILDTAQTRSQSLMAELRWGQRLMRAGGNAGEGAAVPAHRRPRFTDGKPLAGRTADGKKSAGGAAAHGLHAAAEAAQNLVKGVDSGPQS